MGGQKEGSGGKQGYMRRHAPITKGARRGARSSVTSVELESEGQDDSSFDRRPVTNGGPEQGEECRANGRRLEHRDSVGAVHLRMDDTPGFTHRDPDEN